MVQALSLFAVSDTLSYLALHFPVVESQTIHRSLARANNLWIKTSVAVDKIHSESRGMGCTPLSLHRDSLVLLYYLL